ncbi:intermembrane transport protein PqiB [Thalassotalea agariperforans]
MTNKLVVPAEIKEVKSISKLWFLPLVALLIGCWMLYYQWSNQGSLITIHFLSAEGIEAGKTKIKFLNVNIGDVTSVQLNEDGDDVLVTARMSKAAEKLLVTDSQFWVVSPKVSLDGISGLSTIISGVYIQLSRGVSTEYKDKFYALESPPVTPLGTPGLHITLNSNDQFAYEKGDPITYKGLTVGQFEDIYFNFEERVVYYNAFIKAPYHKLITTNTKFWDITGLNVDLKADGLSIKTGNLETILSNGVTFDVPTGMPAGERVTDRYNFDIYESYQTASDQRYKHYLEYVVLVSDTVRGLVVGAPVEYRGITIGQVTSINITPEKNRFFTEDFKIPVLIRVHPGRIGLTDDQAGLDTMQKQHVHWIKNGLKAMLRTGNLLTGSLFIELQHHENEAIDTIDKFNNYTVIPTAEDQFSNILAKVEEFIDKLNKLPLNNTVGNVDDTLANINAMTADIAEVSETMTTLLNNLDQAQLGKELTATLKSISHLTKDFSADSVGYQQLNNTLKSLSSVLQELEPVLIQLKQQPNSLMFNSGQTQILEPKKHTGAER